MKREGVVALGCGCVTRGGYEMDEVTAGLFWKCCNCISGHHASIGRHSLKFLRCLMANKTVLFYLVLLLQSVVSHSYIRSAGEYCSPSDKRLGKRDQITSPSYPLAYHINRCTQWFIRAPHQQDIVTISISDLDIPGGDNCTQSYLMLGPKPQVQWCGQLEDGFPRVYISATDHVWIKLITHGDSIGRGFQLTYITGEVPSREPCLSDEFTCSNRKCILQRWKCNGASECGDENSSDEQSCTEPITPQPTPGPYACGNNKFGCFDIITNKYECKWDMKLCDGQVDCHGRQDEIKCDGAKQCGDALEGPSGFFTSPNFNRFMYDDNQHCTWIIHVDLGFVIQLRFISFHLEDVPNTDFVTVYDGESRLAEMLGRYYGSYPPPKTLESTGNRMFITFDSNEEKRYRGFNASYQIKGVCMSHQRMCKFGENDCYDISGYCDSVWDCTLHGGDERGCGHCKDGLFMCSAKGNQCYLEKEHCNGVAHCNDYQDEKNCTPQQCGPHNGTFLCRNHRCIYETWSCDGHDDCGDNSDEMHCSQPSVKVITAAVIGSLICGLLLVIALGCTCKLYALRLQELHGSSRYTSPLTRLQEEIYARRLAPPPYNEAMVTSRPFNEVQQEYLEHMRNVAQQHRQGRHAGHSHSGDRGHGGRSVTTDGTAASDARLNEQTSDEELLDIGEERGHESVRSSEHGTSSTSESDSELEICPNVDSSNVSISIATGMSAQWRRGRIKHNRINPRGLPSPQVEEGGMDTLGMQQDGLITTDGNQDTASASMSMDSMVLSLADDKDSPGVHTELQPQVVIHQPLHTSSQYHNSGDHEGSDGVSIRSMDSIPDTEPLLS